MLMPPMNARSLLIDWNRCSRDPARRMVALLTFAEALLQDMPLRQGYSLQLSDIHGLWCHPVQRLNEGGCAGHTHWPAERQASYR